MKSFLISDDMDTLIGMRLAGIEGVIRKSKPEILEAIESLKKQKELGIIIITEKIFSLAEEEIIKIKLDKSYPLIVEIPNRGGSKRGDYLLKYIKESIGVKI